MMTDPQTETVRVRIPLAGLLLAAVFVVFGVVMWSHGVKDGEVTATAPNKVEAGAAQAPASSALTNMSSPPEASFDADECIHGPGSVPAGLTKITLTNMGKAIHQIQLVELKDGRTFDDVTRALQSPDNPDPSWLTYAGGPNAVVPGRSASAFVDLKPGNYVVICTIANSLGKPHYTQGMAMQLTVTDGNAAAVAAPPADLEVSASDFSFHNIDRAGALGAGPRAVSFVNEGTQPHEAALIRLDEGATAADYFQAVAAAGDKPLPGTRVGGLGAIEPGEAQTFMTDLTPGRYALICFVIDPAARVAHAAMGMTKEFDVN
jgi:uncharacterized cupredoxin-like copper-binding protein